MCEVFREIRLHNPDRNIVLILDNFRSHRVKDSAKCADECGTQLIFLPPYSPDLNPIEFIWKSIKRVISRYFIKNLDDLKKVISDLFSRLCLSP